MVSVVPQTAGLGDLLGLGASQGLIQGGEHYLKEQSKRAVSERLAKILGVGPAQSASGAQGGGFGGITPDKIIALAADPELAGVASIMAQLYAPEHKAQVEQAQEVAAKRDRSKRLLETTEEQEKLLPYTGSTSIPFTKSFNATKFGLNRKGLEKRELFDNLSADAASFFRDLETKGQLPQGLYEKVIEPRLPNSKLSERENLGRLKGIKSLAKKYGGLKDSDFSDNKSSSGKKLSRANAQKILQESGGDAEKARERARELGYDF
jgi:hypothetical protein